MYSTYFPEPCTAGLQIYIFICIKAITKSFFFNIKRSVIGYELSVANQKRKTLPKSQEYINPAKNNYARKNASNYSLKRFWKALVVARENEQANQHQYNNYKFQM